VQQLRAEGRALTARRPAERRLKQQLRPQPITP
jgi:hypothetical protein